MSCPCHQLRLSEGESGPAQCTDQWRGNAAEALLQGSGEAPVMAGTRQCRVFPRFGPLGELDDAAFQPFAFPAFLPWFREMQAEIFRQLAGQEVPAFGQEMDMVVEDLIEDVCPRAEIGACGKGEAAVYLRR